jgi:DNA invertase Pin-like site-specific DNA recombinase
VKVVGYIRVSTSEQADSGAGLEAQRTTIRAACEAKGWELVALHEDAGLSGARLDRPGLQEALAEVEAGTADGIVVAKVDRLSRSLLHFTTLIERSRKKGWQLVALDLGVDTSTASGELMANTIASFAQFERRLIGERTRAALAAKKAEGVRLGRPRSLPAEVVDEILTRREKSETYKAIADVLNEQGVPTAHGGTSWWPATIRKIVKSYGDSEHGKR